MAEVASLSAIIGADTSGFTAALAAAEGSLRRFAADVETRTGKASSAFEANMKRIGAAGESLKDLGSTLSIGVTAPLVLFGATALNTAGDFESGFNRVQAATQASGAELAALRKEALDISLDPKLKFSATEAAAALENLAKNGLNTTQILGGAADATVNLATATGGQLASSADIATDVMNNFNLTAQQLAASVDNITGTTIASKLDIDNYRQALGQAGGVAGQLGVKFTDFNTALAVTSSGFSSGSDAGTSFKTFLQRLVPQSKEAAAAMKQLGLNFFNAQGQLKPLREIAGELQDAFKGLSDQQRNQLGTQIFGSDSIRTALLLAKDGTAGFDKMAESIGKVNAAAQGEILSQGFNGALEAAKSALEGFQIALGESGLLDLGTKFLRSAAGALSSLAQLDPAILSTGTALAAAAAAIGPLLAGIGALGAALPAIGAGLTTVAATLSLTVGPFALLVAAVAGTVIAIISNWDDIVAYFNGPDGKIFQELARSVGESFTLIKDAFANFDGLGDTVFSEFGQLVGGVIQVVAVAITGLLDTIVGLVRTVDGLLTGNWNKAWDGAKQSVVGVAGFVAELFGYDYADLRAKLNILGDGPLEGVSVLKNSFLDLNAGLSGFLQVAPAVVAAEAEVGVAATGAASGVAALTEAQQKALAAFNDSLRLNENLSRALGQDQGLRVVGDDYDYVGGRAKALESGITSLIRAGFGPQSGVVQNAVRELQQLRNAYDDLGKVQFKLPTTTGENNFNGGQFALPELLAPSIPALIYAQRVGEEAVRLEESFRLLNSAAGAGQLEALNRQTAFNTNIESLFDSLGEGISSAVGTVASSLGDAFGEIVANGASIGDGLTIVFSGILNALAGFMGQFGQQLIAIGIGKLALDTLFKGPAGGPLAIAAGVGLVALAGVAKALAKSSAGSLGAITGSGGAAAGGGNTVRPNANAKPEPIRIDLNLQPVEIRQKGPDLAGVLKQEDYRRRRTNGQRN